MNLANTQNKQYRDLFNNKMEHEMSVGLKKKQIKLTVIRHAQIKLCINTFGNVNGQCQLDENRTIDNQFLLLWNIPI